MVLVDVQSIGMVQVMAVNSSVIDVQSEKVTSKAVGVVEARCRGVNEMMVGLRNAIPLGR